MALEGLSVDIVSRKKHVSWLGKTSGMGLAQDSEPSPQHMKSPTETWVCVCVWSEMGCGVHEEEGHQSWN